jgi:3-deoxy-7-phosphoheptulonate synthase
MEVLMQKIKQFFRSMTDGLRTEKVAVLPSPRVVREKYPLSAETSQNILNWRSAVKDILEGRDKRFLAIVGPCSIHNEPAALDYFRWLKGLADRFSDRIFIVGRSCFEKPRTRNGWEGALADWDGDESCDLEKGLYHCRHFLVRTAELGLPVALEALDQNSEQFFSDSLTMAWIGARTVEATTLRRMISAMSMPVGIKNSTSGDISSAMDALIYASLGRTFPGLDLFGRLAAIVSQGNKDTFLILRGGKRPDYFFQEKQEMFEFLEKRGVEKEIIGECQKFCAGAVRPNYFEKDIAEAAAAFSKEGLKPKIVVDVSHGNSEKNHLRQIDVWQEVLKQRTRGNSNIIGAMLESYSKLGSQKYQKGFLGLDPEISITDACLGRKETEDLLSWTYEQLV